MDLFKARDLVLQYNLEVPDGFWRISSIDLVERVGSGGCGPGNFGDWLVPDTMWGLSIKPACLIHDLMYYEGKTIEDKRNADWVFLNNCDLIIDIETWFWPIKKLRRRRALTYHWAVCQGGDKYFEKTSV